MRPPRDNAPAVPRMWRHTRGTLPGKCESTVADDDERPLEEHTPNVKVGAAAGISGVPWVGGPIATLLMERWTRMSQRNVAEYVRGGSRRISKSWHSTLPCSRTP
jgi:hypothetical protein